MPRSTPLRPEPHPDQGAGPHLRPPVRVQHIRSPLTRAGYTLTGGIACLLLIEAGLILLRRPAGPDSATRIEGPRLVWLADGAGQELIAEGGTRARILSIPGPDLVGALPVTPLGDQMRRTFGQDISLPHDPRGRIPALTDGLEAERAGAEPGSDMAEWHYLSLILVQLWRLARADLVAHGRAPQGLAERFVLLAGQRLRDHLGVGDYARMLGVSRDRLGTAVRRATGLSPQGYLHQRLVREASELLASTGMPVGQIAFRLGFSDPAYFSRFFTRQRGDSPAAFRRAARSRRAAGDQSYAAWP